MFMLTAFYWAIFSASSLVIGALVALHIKLKPKDLGLIMSFGVGVLVSAVAFELVDEAFKVSHNLLVVLLGLILGAFIYTISDYLISNKGGRAHKSTLKSKSESNGFSILLGTILDGIPESIIIGLSIASGITVSYAMVVAVYISNLPEAIASTSGLKDHWTNIKIYKLWIYVVLISGLASVFGYLVFSIAGSSFRAFILTFSAGALLTMIANNMMPEAYKESGKLTGIITTLGFCLAYLISAVI